MKVDVKRLVLLNVGVLLIIFLTAGVLAGPENDEDMIKGLLNQRTKILNQYYRGAEDFERVEKKLEAVEMGSLLTKDRKAMRINAGMDFEPVTKSKIKITECSRSSMGMLKGTAEITWVLEGMHPGEKPKLQTALYFFTAEAVEKRIKLTGFELK